MLLFLNGMMIAKHFTFYLNEIANYCKLFTQDLFFEEDGDWSPAYVSPSLNEEDYKSLHVLFVNALFMLLSRTRLPC